MGRSLLTLPLAPMQKTPTNKPAPKPIDANELIALWQGSKWNRAVQVTNSLLRSGAGTVADRCMIFLLRCESFRRLHDRKAFDKSLADYRKERERLTAAERAKLDGMLRQGWFRIEYQKPRFRPRPDAFLSRTEIEKRGLNGPAFETLRRKSRDSYSEALYVWQDGKALAEEHFDAPQEPICIMSVTKPVVAMAVGRLLDTGKLKSLDQPASDFYPQWKTDERRGSITLRHLLTHTSGIGGAGDIPEVQRPTEMRKAFADLVSYGLDFPIAAEPGEKWIYSNPAIYLLADIVAKASGKPTDTFVRDEFLKPMEISEWEWSKDPKGNVEGAGGLCLRAHDMAKFGVLMLEGGVWKGKRLLSETFVRDSLRVQVHGSEPGGIDIPDAPALGLIWFLETEPQRMMRRETMEKWRAAGVSGPQIEKIQPYLDKPMPKTEYDALVKRLYGVQGANDLAGWRKALGFSGYLPTADDAPDRLTAFYHSGSDGQYLVVFPQSRLVAVRQTVRKDLRDIGRDSDYSAFLKDASLLTGRQIFDVTH